MSNNNRDLLYKNSYKLPDPAGGDLLSLVATDPFSVLSFSALNLAGTVASLGATPSIPPLIILAVGQSNGQGHEAVGVDLLAPSNTFYQHPDLTLRTYTEPSAGDDTGSVYPTASHEGAGYSMFGAVATALRAGGLTAPIIIVNTCVDGTGSLAWTNPGAPDSDRKLGIAMLRVQSILATYPTAKLVVVIYNGEKDAIAADESAAHQANWQYAIDDIETWATANSIQWYSALHYHTVHLPPTAAPGKAYWEDVRAAQVALVAANASKARLVPAPDGPRAGDDLHLLRAAQEDLGYRMGDSILGTVAVYTTPASVTATAVAAAVTSGEVTPLTLVSSTTIRWWVAADRANNVTESGVRVTQLTDQTGNSRHFTAGTGTTARPTLNTGGPNGKPYVTFDGVANILANTSFVPPATGSLWVVARRNNSGSGLYLFNSSNTGTARMSVVTNSTSLRMHNTTAVNATACATGAWNLIWSNFTGSTSDELKVGSAGPTTGASAGTTGGLGGCYLGAAGNGSNFLGFDLLEAFFSAAKPTETELTNLVNYVTAKYGSGNIGGA